MTEQLSHIAARLREFILTEGPAAQSQTVTDNKTFDSLALELFALQFTHNTAYRRICEVRGASPKSVEHWSQIPAVPTSGFKELELSSIPANERTAVFHSSGTTEQRPSRHFHDAESLAVYEASLWSSFERNVVPDLRFAKYDLLVLTPPPEQAPNSSLIHMFEVVRKKLSSTESAFVGSIDNESVWTLDFDATLDGLRSPNPKLILGTAFSFVHLLDHLEEKNLRLALPPGSRVMETGGYKNRSRTMPKAELHALITHRLGVSASHIICEYGMSELSSQAYDTQSGSTRTFHFPRWARVQIISPETGLPVADGETGLIRILDLANVFSVMAVQTEDLGIRRGEQFELLGRAQLAEPRGCSLMTA
ncbi:MAG TPA: hypothetical protein VH255_07005 [Verrucomicrobiae bacterium]|nr:hypothetical protein [Verrucomicrobiae bacterium]